MAPLFFPSAPCYGPSVFMKVLMLSPDRGDLFDPASPAARRFVQYGDLVERFDVLLPDAAGRTIHPSERVTFYGVRAQNRLAYVCRIVQQFRKLQKTRSYDVLTTRDPYFLGAIALLLARVFGLGLEIQVHGFEKLGWIRRRLARFVLSRADSVRAVSERLKRKLIDEFGVPATRIMTYPIFIDATAFPSSSVSSVPHDPFTFLTIGRLVPVKNIALQLRALAEVRPTADVRLTVLGEGPFRADLEKLAKDLQIESAVDFVGFVKEVAPFFAQADVFLLTSFEEGYGLAPIEAACAGLPVIMTDVGCANEVIRHEENGLIIPVADQVALVAAMRRLMADGDLRTAIRARNVEIRHALPTHEATLSNYRASWERAARHAALRNGLS